MHDADLRRENEELRARAEQAEELVRAIRSGEVDALVVDGPHGEQVYTLSGADRPYRQFLDAMSEGAVMIARDGTILYGNRAFSQLLAAPLELLIGTSLFACFPDRSDEHGGFSMQDIGTRVELDIGTRDGRRVPVAVSSQRVAAEAEGFATLVITDLSGRRLQDRLARREAQLRYAAQLARLFPFTWDLTTGAMTWPPRLKAMWGLAGHAAVTFDMFMAGVHPDDRPLVNERVTRALDLAGEGEFEVEFRVQGASGGEHWLAARGRTTVVAGSAVSLSGVAQDVTARNRAEQALREKQRFITQFAAAFPGVLYVFDVERQHTSFLNRTSGDILGYGADEMRVPGGQTLSRLMHPDDLPRFEAHLAGVTSLADQTTTEFEYRMRHRDGGWRWFRSYETVFERTRDGRVGQVLGMAIDVTERKAIEFELRANEERFRLASDAAGALVYDVDLRSGDRRTTVHGLESVTGVHSTSISREWWQERMHPHDVEGHRDRLTARLGDSTRVWTDRYRIRHADGTWRDVVDSAEILRGQEGQPVRLVGTVVDVTERASAERELREAEERFRLMADQTPMLLWVTDTKGSVEFVNRAYCRFFGVELEQVVGPRWTPLVHPDDYAYTQAFLAALRARSEFRAEARAQRADGEWRWIASLGTPRYSATGEFLGMIGTSRDTTDEHLAVATQQEAARQKDEFIAVLAHELRNPLAPVRTSIGLLRARGSTDPLLARCRDVIDRQVTQMARLLDDLLDVSRLSRGQLTLQRSATKLSEIIEAALETARPAIDERGHTLTLAVSDPSVVLDADSTRLTQVFANLLNNAAKYTDAGGQIRLASWRDAERVYVSVRDSGVGIEADMRDRIFDLFTQTRDARSRADGGLGIGLGLARRLVEMHGGTIEVASAGHGCGSEFRVSLPCVGASRVIGSEPQATRPAATGSLRRRVLVADDNVDAADTVALLLQTLGCEVRTVYDGASAVREAQAFRPDLALLDLGMPGVSGQTACRQIRAESWGASIVIVALTGWGQEDDRRQTASAGFDHHLIKPAEPEVLIQLVRDLQPRMLHSLPSVRSLRGEVIPRIVEQ